jgi:hypothetical protein
LTEAPRCGLGKKESSFSEEKEAKRRNYSPPVRGLQTIDPGYFRRPDPGSSNRRQKVKVFWFFSSEKNRIFFF